MCGDNHVAGSVGDNCVRVSISIIENFVWPFHCIFGRICLLCGDGAKSCEHGVFHCPRIVQKGARNFLDKPLAFLSQGVHLGPPQHITHLPQHTLVWCGGVAGLEASSVRCGVVESCESFRDVVEHG